MSLARRSAQAKGNNMARRYIEKYRAYDTVEHKWLCKHDHATDSEDSCEMIPERVTGEGWMDDLKNVDRYRLRLWKTGIWAINCKTFIPTDLGGYDEENTIIVDTNVNDMYGNTPTGAYKYAMLDFGLGRIDIDPRDMSNIVAINEFCCDDNCPVLPDVAFEHSDVAFTAVFPDVAFTHVHYNSEDFADTQRTDINHVRELISISNGVIVIND